jgi:hypothetical protein
MNATNILNRARAFVSYDTDENQLQSRDIDSALQQLCLDLGFVQHTDTISLVANQREYQTNIVVPERVVLNGEEIKQVYDDDTPGCKHQFPRIYLNPTPMVTGTLVVAGWGIPSGASNMLVPANLELLLEDAAAALAAGKFLLRFRDNVRAQMFLAEYHNIVRRVKPRPIVYRQVKPVPVSIDVI